MRMRASALAWSLLLGGLLVAGGVAAEPTHNGSGVELRVLTYNTHGLASWIAGDRPGRRFPRIGRLFNRYDLVLVQEDFAHHSRLREVVTHPIVERGNGRSGFLGWLCPSCGAGLTTLVGLPAPRLIDSHSEAYDACSGWFLAGNDCWAEKGFLRVAVELPNGARLDVVNTHLDAGRSKRDRAARRRQLDRLTRRLLSAGDGRALVVGGDFNLDWDVPGDRGLLLAFQRALGLRDTRARPANGSPWEAIDYLMVRSGPEARIEVLEAGMAEEFTHKDRPLSDHPALRVRLLVSPAEPG